MLSPMSRRIVLLKVEAGGADNIHAGARRDLSQLYLIPSSAARHRVNKCFPTRFTEFQNVGTGKINRIQEKVRIVKRGKTRINNDVLMRVANARGSRVDVAGNCSKKWHN